MAENEMNAYLKSVCDSLLAGKEEIVSDETLDKLLPYNISIYIASRFNPNQIGTKDRYIAYIKPESLKRIKLQGVNPFGEDR